MEDKFYCQDCKEWIDSSRLIETVSRAEVCELCAVKCSVCDELQSPKEVNTFNGDFICDACREHLFIIYDSYYKTYLFSVGTEGGTTIWNADKTEIKLFDSRIEAEMDIDILSGNKRYQIQKL